ncbi:UDP-glycosyltransferase 85A2 [Striga hermonthica]|uniref:7-deoxyloganetin glucosyltransferase n=1 Tax=Striga hermonthica TaxID=68872 RepID=A0A9N7NT31_STRHE|nr:UDP-glycosyltransferase 85A2 [Striga hermonthica]
MKPQPHAVLIPYPAQGHIAPVLKLAKLLHSKGFFITFVNTEFNHNRLLRARGPESVSGLPGFQFRTIPDGLPPSDKDATQDIPALCDSLDKNGCAPFLDLIGSLNGSTDCPNVSCIVSDGVMSFTLDAAEKLGIPEVVFFTTSACGFLAYCHYAELKARGLFPLKDESQITNGYLETEVEWVPGMENIRLRDFPSFIRTTDPDDIMVNYNILQTKNASRARAVILNTFDDLERPVLAALRRIFDSVLTVGPLQLLEHRLVQSPDTRSIGSSLWKEDDACVPWLDRRAPDSVLYVNFGSITVLSPEQLLEFAWGLANSGHHFLWIIRPDLVTGDKAVLPEEYSKEVSGRAMMVGWCSQERVLAHPAVGGFLTHSGWNSTVEGVSEGVPMISWPFFAEQQTNCRYVCRDWGMGVEIEGEVRRDKVAELVKVLMEGEKGKEMRKRAAGWKEKARLAVGPDGSSYKNLESVVENDPISARNFSKKASPEDLPLPSTVTSSSSNPSSKPEIPKSKPEPSFKSLAEEQINETTEENVSRRRTRLTEGQGGAGELVLGLGVFAQEIFSQDSQWWRQRRAIRRMSETLKKNRLLEEQCTEARSVVGEKNGEGTGASEIHDEVGERTIEGRGAASEVHDEVGEKITDGRGAASERVGSTILEAVDFKEHILMKLIWIILVMTSVHL